MKETNMEHYRERLKENEYRYDFGVENGKLIVCEGFCYKCKYCDLSNEKNPNDGLSACMNRKLKWLMSEYKPEPFLTAREKHFVECVEDGWLTKSKSNIITWWEKKPSRDGKHGWIVTDTSGFVYLQEIHPCAFGDMFPFITWEDEEPWAVEDLRKLKVEE